jgi:hypothetical protein
MLFNTIKFSSVMNFGCSDDVLCIDVLLNIWQNKSGAKKATKGR